MAPRPYTSSFMRWSADMMLPAAAADQGFSAEGSKQTYTATLVGQPVQVHAQAAGASATGLQARMRGAIF